ncbi:MAG: DNA-binding GntR family transcriptional regulator [Reinekea sp.]|jgi:DNA-binding GntR family transcriptional regulator
MIGSLDPIDMAEIKTTTPARRKADGVAATLEHQIIAGLRAPGSRLDERGLAEEFGVSRTPIREAIRQLASMGLLEDLGRRGIVVAKPTVTTVLDAFLVVAELEGIAARLSAQRIKPDQLHAARDANDKCAEATSVTAFNLANMALHDAIIAGSHNVLLVDQLRTARPTTFPYRHHLTQAPGYREKSVGEHAQVIDAIAQGDAQAAQTLMTMHVNLQGEDIINFLRNFGQTFTGSGSST